MSLPKISLWVALLAAAGTAGGLHQRDQARAREAAMLRDENDRLRRELEQRRAASASLFAPATVILPATEEPEHARNVPATPAVYYRNEGNATPLATLQTFAWACDRGDVDTVERLIHFDPVARVKAAAYRDGLPASVRTQWATLDEMAAALMAHDAMQKPFPIAEILATATVEPIGENRVRLRLPHVPRDGTEYVRTAEGWKYVITETMVDGYLRHLAQPAGPR